MDSPQQDVDGVVHGLPDLVFGDVHALLHVAACLESEKKGIFETIIS